MTTSRAPIRLLLTGFGSFPGVADNASATLVEQLAIATRKLSGVHVTTQVLAVDWEAAPRQVATLIAAESPDIILHFGVSRRATGIVIESTAHNVCGHLLDTCGAVAASGKIADEADDTLASTFPVQAIMLRLQSKGLQTQLSDDAGAYLCNAVLYTSLHLCRGSAVQVGFIHLPVDLRGTDGDLSMPDAVDGALEIIRTCIEAQHGR